MGYLSAHTSSGLVRSLRLNAIASDVAPASLDTETTRVYTESVDVHLFTISRL